MHPIVRSSLPLALLLAGVAHASEEARLIERINALRAEPPACEGHRPEPVGPLSTDLRLSEPTQTDVGSLQQALSQNGYPVSALQLIRLSGPADADTALAALGARFCGPLLAARYTDVGVSRSGQEWRIVLARPLLSASLGDWEAEGHAVLEAANRARASARACGQRTFPAAPPLAWSAALAEAARAHSLDMANHDRFSHRGSDGSLTDERVLRTGYTWHQLGENIAAGQDAAQATVDGWLASPGHCANLMSAAFTEMGAAYAVDPNSQAGIYWTQVFAAP